MQLLVWVKIAQIWTFLQSKVPKIINNQNFPKNTKCSKYMIFRWIFNFRLKNTPKGPPDTKDPPLDVGMTQAHQPMVQILISLAQMVHFGWEQPLIIVDFGISKICVFSAHPKEQGCSQMKRPKFCLILVIFKQISPDYNLVPR